MEDIDTTGHGSLMGLLGNEMSISSNGPLLAFLCSWQRQRVIMVMLHKDMACYEQLRASDEVVSENISSTSVWG